MDGGEGIDIAIYSRPKNDYNIHFDTESNTWTVENINYENGIDEGSDMISNVEILAFADQDYPLNGAAANLIGVINF